MKAGQIIKWGLIIFAVYWAWNSGLFQSLLPAAVAPPVALPPGYDPVAAAQAAAEGT
jgi:hypothetical protein